MKNVIKLALVLTIGFFIAEHFSKPLDMDEALGFHNATFNQQTEINEAGSLKFRI